MEHVKLTTNIETVAQRAATVLASGGLIVYPTETMYGVGVDAQNPEAVTKLLQFKNRPAGKAISCLMLDQKMAEQYVELSDSAQKAYAAFLPGPVTVVSKDRGLVDHRLTSELGTLGVRISSYEFVKELIQVFGKPITSTSANPSGGARPYAIESLFTQLSDRQKNLIDLVVDAGELPHNEPSTVIDTTSSVQEIIRAGTLTSEIISSFQSKSEEETYELAKKMIEQFAHVLPEKPLIFALEGEMGMGKTHFAKGVAQALGVIQIVNSPTYSLVKEYIGQFQNHNVRFIHMDCWRASAATAEEVGLPDYLHPRTVVVIEWAAPLVPYLRDLKDSVVTQRLLFNEQNAGRSIQLLQL